MFLISILSLNLGNGFSIFCKVEPVDDKLLALVCIGKCLFLPHFWTTILSCKTFLIGSFLLSFHFLLFCKVFIDKAANSIIAFSLSVSMHFLLFIYYHPLSLEWRHPEVRHCLINLCPTRLTRDSITSAVWQFITWHFWFNTHEMQI